MAIGNRVFLKKPEVDVNILRDFESVPAANTADTMGRLCSMHPRIKLLSRPKKDVVAGRALTVKCRAGDNLMLHKALNMAKEDDVIIVSNDSGQSFRSLIGEIMFTFAEYKRIGGIIIDGPVRDMDSVKDMKLPIYATGSNPGGPYKDGNGEVNVPISCGGVSINPGDIVVMDSDGVVIVPLRDAETVLAVAKEYHKNDAAKLEAAATGKSKRDWVERRLEDIGTEIIDDYYM